MTDNSKFLAIMLHKIECICAKLLYNFGVISHTLRRHDLMKSGAWFGFLNRGISSNSKQ